MYPVVPIPIPPVPGIEPNAEPMGLSVNEPVPVDQYANRPPTVETNIIRSGREQSRNGGQTSETGQHGTRTASKTYAKSHINHAYIISQPVRTKNYNGRSRVRYRSNE